MIPNFHREMERGGKFVKQNFVILIPGGKMSEDVILLH